MVCQLQLVVMRIVVLGSINPEDIELISILKDAASAAIYGSRVQMELF